MTAAGFRVRKVKTQQYSIGDRLKRTRIRHKISISEAEESTRIRAKFLLALEADSWDQIPSEVYGRGYLERYAIFLKLPVAEIMGQYDRERCHYAKHCQDAQAEFTPQSNVRLPKFYLTPRLLIIVAAVLAMAAVGGAVTHQLKVFASAPFLEITSAKQGSEYVAVGHSFTLRGKTLADATVNINGNPASVHEDGNFQQDVTVQKGINAVVVEAGMPNGKKSTEVISVIVP